jgi:hypothetical protein
MINAVLGRKEDAIRQPCRAVELLPVTKDAWAGAAVLTALKKTTGSKYVRRTGGMPMFLLIQSREDFWIAYIGPFARKFERFHFFARLREIAMRQIANGIG